MCVCVCVRGRKREREREGEREREREGERERFLFCFVQVVRTALEIFACYTCCSHPFPEHGKRSGNLRLVQWATAKVVSTILYSLDELFWGFPTIKLSRHGIPKTCAVL